MALTASITSRIQARLTGTSDLGSPADTVDWPVVTELRNGTGLNQANNMWSDRRTLSSGANENLDMSGVLVGALGNTLAFTKIKAIAIYADPDNTVDLTVTRPATNGLPFLLAAGDGFVLKPGGFYEFRDPSAAGVTVTAATGDLINIANGAASSTYEIVVIGAV